MKRLSKLRSWCLNFTFKGKKAQGKCSLLVNSASSGRSFLGWHRPTLQGCHKALGCSSTIQQLSTLLSKEILRVKHRWSIKQVTAWTSQRAKPELRKYFVINITAEGSCPSILHWDSWALTQPNPFGVSAVTELMLLKGLFQPSLLFFFSTSTSHHPILLLLYASLKFYQPFTANSTNPQVFFLVFCRCSEMNLLRQEPKCQSSTGNLPGPWNNLGEKGPLEVIKSRTVNECLGSAGSGRAGKPSCSLAPKSHLSLLSKEILRFFHATWMLLQKLLIFVL